MAHPLYLQADSLFSKWGFGDGDCIGDWYWEATGEPLPDDVDEHAVLRKLVRTVLVPAIEAAGHVVEVGFMQTIHNPVRALIADGVIVTDSVIFGGDPPAWAEEISVAILLDQRGSDARAVKDAPQLPCAVIGDRTSAT